LALGRISFALGLGLHLWGGQKTADQHGGAGKMTKRLEIHDSISFKI